VGEHLPLAVAEPVPQEVVMVVGMEVQVEMA
jgi:hypothetical protein